MIVENQKMEIKSKVRQSNMELLRIIAILFVVVTHTDYFAIGEPSSEFCKHEMLKASFQYFIESFSIVCVNCFIFISGWFSIKPTVKGLANLLFQLVYYNLLVYFCFLTYGLIQFDIEGFVRHLNILNFWFIRCYIALYLISPILNKFIEHSSKDLSRRVVILFAALDVVMGWGLDCLQFDGGYSLLHFMVIYLIARYIHVHGTRVLSYDKKWDLSIYLLISIAAPVLVIVSYYLLPVVWHHSGRLFLYNSPFVMLSSVCLCLFFAKLKFRSRIVNFVGASAFAVFLIHGDALISKKLLPEFCTQMFHSYDIFSFSAIITVSIIILFLVSIFVDQFRKWLWKYIQRVF